MLHAVQTLVQYQAEVESLIEQRAVDKKALESANKQVLQLSADRAESTAACELLQSVNASLEKHQERMQESLDSIRLRIDHLEAERPSKKLKVCLHNL